MSTTSDAVFTPVRGRRVVEEVVDQIVNAIQVGDLGIGDRLPPERTLSAHLEVSRPTVREALKLLVDAQVLGKQHGSTGGLIVTNDVVPADLIETQVQLQMVDLASVLEARRILEPRIAVLASVYATPDDLDALQRSIELQATYRNDRVRFNEIDQRFHLLLARATQNRTVVQMLKTLQDDVRMARDMSMRSDFEPDQSIDLHQRTLDAVRHGDEATIESVMDEHLRQLEQLFEHAGGRLRSRLPPSFLLPASMRRSI